jgi:hypothetical protein
MADTITLGGKQLTVADLEKMSTNELVAAMDELDARREKAKAEGRIVKEVLTKKLSHEAIVSKLAGLDQKELEAVLAIAGKDPKALSTAVAKSRSLRPVLEVNADTSNVKLTAEKS